MKWVTFQKHPIQREQQRKNVRTFFKICEIMQSLIYTISIKSVAFLRGLSTRCDIVDSWNNLYNSIIGWYVGLG